MQRSSKLRLTEVSPHLICALCGGYLIDATTIVECLHSFCKTCIVRYLESSKYCPICEVLVHKTRPLQNIRLDHTLQDIVYKLVPGLFKDEMTRRREYYKDSPTIRSAEIRQQQQRHRVIFSADEMFSVCLQFCPDGKVQPPVVKRGRKSTKNNDRRYLLCPAGTTMIHLKKFIRLKFSLSEQYQVDLFHAQGNLRDNYSLMDVAYIYSWKRDGVLQLHYSIFKEPIKIPKITVTEVKVEPGLNEENKTEPSFFRSSSLIGNDCCDSDLPHDLSPLELIATVANGLSSLPEGRGQKRNADAAELYDDDTPNSNEIQIQKSIEHAIEMCSSNTVQEKQTKETGNFTKTVVSDDKPLAVVKVENDKKIESNPQNNTEHSKTTIIETKPSLQNEIPKKTDTASQCDPRPRKGENKSANSNLVHSKTYSKQVKHAKLQSSGEVHVSKTGKEDTVASELDKRNKTVSEPDKKLTNNPKTNDNKNGIPELVTKINKCSVSDKPTKASPHKQEKKLILQKPEKTPSVQKSDDLRENIASQKSSIPQINGVCSGANDIEKDKLSKTKT